MVFLTVGTSFPFDRLVKAVDDAVARGSIKREIFAQISRGGYRPRAFDFVETLPKADFDSRFRIADAIIAHAGMGTIAMALELRKPILVMPRRRKYGEIVNDHQLVAAREYEKLGHLVAAYEASELATKFEILWRFDPVPRISEAKRVSHRIGCFIGQVLEDSLWRPPG